MLTQCPNPKCKYTFDVPDDAQGKNGPCPQCGQVITFRSLDVIREVERQHQLRLEKKAQSAGSDATPETFRFSALLEDIRSLWNVGSIFRTADGAGFGKLYLCGITGCPPSKAIAKTSLGAEDCVSWQQAPNALEVLPVLAARGVQIVVLEKTEKSILLTDAAARKLFRPPLCLVVGNEVAGVSAEALSRAELTCHLPMHGVKSSLNVAVAFGIAAYLISAACPSLNLNA
jgi:tRNA G18 (ribose-2'-O)-methylase SpoU